MTRPSRRLFDRGGAALAALALLVVSPTVGLAQQVGPPKRVRVPRAPGITPPSPATPAKQAPGPLQPPMSNRPAGSPLGAPPAAPLPKPAVDDKKGAKVAVDDKKGAKVAVDDKKGAKSVDDRKGAKPADDKKGAKNVEPDEAPGRLGAPAGGKKPVDLLENPPEGLPLEKALVSDCPAKIPPGKKFKWDLRGETDLAQLVQWASATLCRPVVVPQNLRQQKVQIYAPGLIYAEEARRLFFSALTSMGLTVQPEGPKDHEVFTIIESNRSHELPVPLYGPDEKSPPNDSFVTKMMRLQNVSTDEMLQVLNRLKSKDGDVVGFAPTGTLIITDLSENIRRMERVIRQLDVPQAGGDRIWVVRLHNTAATEMATLLDKIFGVKQGQPGAAARANRVNFAQPQVTSAPVQATAGSATAPDTGAGGPPTVTQIIPEDRSNTLIVIATERAYGYVLSLIRRLDQAGGPLDTAADRVHVYFLANANAEEIGGTLSGLGVGVSGGRGRSGARAPGAPSSPGQAGSLFEGEVKVASDKATNSLIIVASGRDYMILRDLIKKLDITRRQVFIEATILEISLNKLRKLGVSFHAGAPVSVQGKDAILVGGSEPNSQINSIALNPAALSGLATGLIGPNIPGAAEILGLPPGRSIPAFGVFLQALQNNNDVNVISMPHILTSDNEKATIQVGQNVPFPGATFGGAGGGAIPGLGNLGGFGFGAVPVQRQDVALKLEVTPHVNDSDFVRLEIDNEISDVAGTGSLGPTTNKRTVKTTVVVRDQQSVVLGGLIKDKVSESVDKVPLLGDIPILGYLFKFVNKTIDKQNLLIILTPYVIKDPQDMRRIFERKVRERREFLENNSAFTDEQDYEAKIDYRRKRGLLAEINRSAVEAEQEAGELRAAEAAMQGRWQEGVIEPVPLRPPTPPSRAEPDDERPRAPAPTPGDGRSE